MPIDEYGLTPKQRQFCDEYLIDKNATQAAIRAGYSVKTAGEQGSRLLANHKVRAYLAKKTETAAQKLGITHEKVLGELAKLSFSNMQDFIRTTSDGDAYIDLSELTRDQAAALTEVQVDDYVDGRGDDARDVKRIKIKLADKRAALVDLGKHLGLFVEKLEVTGKDGKPLAPTIAIVTPEDAARAYQDALKRAADASGG